jgi:hypothetical protein
MYHQLEKLFFAFDFAGLLSHGGSGAIGAIISILMVIIISA